jgi:hypothetical protein
MTLLAVKSSLGGFTSPYVYTIPADTVIFYNGTYSAAVDGWDIYTDAANKFIVGTATQAEIATTAAASGSSTATATSLSTAGAHSGASVPTAGGYVSLSSARNSAGEHTHAITANGTDSSELKPISTTLTMLRTATEQKFFPANTIHINGTNLVSGTQKLAAASNRYISGGSAVTDNAATSHTMTLTAATYSSDSHFHGNPPYTDYGSTQTSSLQTSYQSSAAPSTHTHVVTATATINALKGKLLKLWISASRQLPKSATVVMYCGNLSLLPPYWKVCDGTNGTIDMQGYFLGYATSSATAHGTVTSETNTYTTTGPTAASDPYTHAHYARNDVYYTQIYRNHGTSTVTHTHTVAGGSVTTDALPANIKLAFIQLVT